MSSPGAWAGGPKVDLSGQAQLRRASARWKRLGGSFVDTTSRVRRKVPPGGEHEAGENAVPENEYPRRSAVVQQALKPMLDEPSVVRLLAALRAKPHFKSRQRADQPEPRFGRDHEDCREMRDAEPDVVDPAPAPEVADDGENEAENDKCGNRHVNDQNGVR